jgi:hypothetical protein
MTGLPTMSLKDGANFLFPDGRRFRAVLEASQTWTFVPSELVEMNPSSWREAISKLLFLLDDGKIISISMYTSPIIMDTCWTVADLRPVN